MKSLLCRHRQTLAAIAAVLTAAVLATALLPSDFLDAHGCGGWRDALADALRTIIPPGTN